MKKKHFALTYNAAQTAMLCIRIIKSEVGIKLNMYSPDFLKSVKLYSKVIDSSELNEAYNDLSIYEKLSMLDIT